MLSHPCPENPSLLFMHANTIHDHKHNACMQPKEVQNPNSISSSALKAIMNQNPNSGALELFARILHVCTLLEYITYFVMDILD